MKAFLIHGSNGHPGKHWYPWIRAKLIEAGITVLAPQFSIGKKQFLKNWLSTFEKYQDQLDDSILIGHSLGVPFIINVLNSWEMNIHAAFLVAGFVGPLNVEEEFNLTDFSVRPFDWQKIKEKCRHFYIIHSDNDPYVPLEKAQELAARLDEEVIMVEGAGHFISPEYRQFPFLWEKIAEILP